jgi:hypothetical protein
MNTVMEQMIVLFKQECYPLGFPAGRRLAEELRAWMVKHKARPDVAALLEEVWYVQRKEIDPEVREAG